ncbi:MAG: TetR/AcrR family transcriptional regulator [Eubacteriales bacterium]|nr:TetR/AcrR family transcriptional regulator [Eubacteriales bacterium]
MEKKLLIYETAKAIFSEKGFKDTSIQAITKAAGIAVGTFYLYYSSKEQLFMEIFKDENTKLKRSFLETLDREQSPRTIIRDMLRVNQQGIQSNPILREWYMSEDFRKIELAYREEHAIDSLDFLYDTFLTLVQRWQAEGKMRSDIDSRVIMKVFEAIINIDTHKDEIGMEYFPVLLDTMTDLVLKGLTDCST